MASRYIARRYGEQTGNRSRASSVVSESTSRASSQVRETQSFYPRGLSLAPPSRGSSPTPDPYERPWSSASNYNTSYDSNQNYNSSRTAYDRDPMFTDFLTSLPLSSAQPASLKSQYQELVQDRYSDRSESGRGMTPSKYQSHLPAWTSSWRNYRGRGAQFTSQFLGKDTSTNLSTPNYNPPRVFIFHKSTVN
eukprot:TRINITY_DN31359_c0_g1_i1.p1 TRINITY_DN31359_c0_g1~~TRINITY_DN31359_c0_g1_i1.p1  ORF type:complete len:193 (-),score=21.83 TRINITY_DN31359_c0_g1_i1:24-602(-)